VKPRISPEVDQLMWIVAEGGDSKAINDFDSRFPDLRSELAKRLEMVRSLRGAKDGLPRTPRIPEFRPRQAELRRVDPRFVWVAAGLVAATIGLAAYSGLQGASPRVHVVEPISTEVPKMPDIVQSDKLPEPTPSPLPTPAPPSPSPTASPAPLPLYDRPQDFAFQNSKLSAVLHLVTHAGGLKLELAPGFVDIEISQSYPDMTPTEVLKALGNEYGFTAFDEGDGTVWVVPARDQTDTKRTQDGVTTRPASDH
jgi:hypothetical protein